MQGIRHLSGTNHRTKNKGRVPFDQKFRFALMKFSHAEWNGFFQHAKLEVLNNNDEVAVVSAVSCLRRRNLTHIGDHFKKIFPRYLPDRLKSYFREIINLRAFLTGDYANRANTHRKFGTTSPQFFRKQIPSYLWRIGNQETAQIVRIVLHPVWYRLAAIL